jgi:hypothetical protein
VQLSSLNAWSAWGAFGRAGVLGDLLAWWRAGVAAPAFGAGRRNRCRPPVAGQTPRARDDTRPALQPYRRQASAKACIEGNSQSGWIEVVGSRVAPRPGRSCLRLIQTVARPAAFAGW